MSRAAWLLALLGAAAVAWLQTSVLPAPARLWTVVLLVPLPALMIVQARQLAELTQLPRRAAYVSSIVSLWVLAVVTWLVGFYSQYSPLDLRIFAGDAVAVVSWTVGVTLGGVAILFIFRVAGAREAPIVRELLPQQPSERILFVLLSLSAGVCEEIAFRGFLLHTLTTASEAPVVAVILSSGAFGVLHAYQQPIGALRAALLGALLAAPLWFGQPLHVPIAAHALIDLLSGLWLARYLIR